MQMTELQHRQMMNEVYQNEMRHEENIAKEINDIPQEYPLPEDWPIKKDLERQEKFLNEKKEKITDELYEALEESYKIVMKWLNQIYGPLSFNPPTEEEIKSLLYAEDGKSIEDRVDEHFESFSKAKHNTEYQDRSRKQALLSKFDRILLNDNVHLVNHLMYNKLVDEARVIIVVGGIGCDECDCPARWGTYKVEDFNETYDMPPYHVGCGCSIIVVT